MLTFEEWRHTYADVFETDDAARAAWTAASNHGYRAGMQDTRDLLTTHSAGAQGEAVGEITDGDEGFLMRFIGAIERIESGITQTTADGLFSKTRERKMTIKDAQEIVRLMLPGLRRVAAKLYAHPQPQTDASRYLSNLLARIHRDGGHYETQYGTEKATADAEMKVAQLNEMTDAARDVKRYQAIRSQVLPFNAYASGNPNWRFPRHGPRGATFDEAIDAEIEQIDRAKGE